MASKIAQELVEELRKCVPFLMETVDACRHAFAADEFNGELSWGVQNYENRTRRLRAAISDGKLNLRFPNEAGDPYFIFGDTTRLRFHSASPHTLVPKNGKTAKAAARVVGDLFDQGADLLGEPIVRPGRDLVVALVYHQWEGLLKVAVGELVRQSGTENFSYAEPPIIIYSAYGEGGGSATDVPPEDVPPPVVFLKEPPEEKPADNTVRRDDEDLGKVADE